MRLLMLISSSGGVGGSDRFVEAHSALQLAIIGDVRTILFVVELSRNANTRIVSIIIRLAQLKKVATRGRGVR